MRERAREPCAWPSRVGVRGARESAPLLVLAPVRVRFAPLPRCFSRSRPDSDTRRTIAKSSIETTDRFALRSRRFETRRDGVVSLLQTFVKIYRKSTYDTPCAETPAS